MAANNGVPSDDKNILGNGTKTMEGKKKKKTSNGMLI